MFDCCFIFNILCFYIGWMTSKVAMPQLGDYFQYKIEITIPYLKYAYEAQVSTCHRANNANIFSVKLWSFSFPHFKTCVLGAQKNRLTETVL